MEVGVLWNSTRHGHDQLHPYPLPRTQNKPQAQMHNLGSNAMARWACPQGREYQRGTQARVLLCIPVGPVPVRAKGCIGGKPRRQNQSGQGHQKELQTTIHTPASGRLALVRLFIQHCSNTSSRPRCPFELLLQVADSSIEPFQCAIHHLL